MNLKMHSKIVNEQVWRCTCRPESSEFGDELAGRDRASLEMHIGGHDRANLEAVIKRVRTSPWEAVDGRRARC